MKGEVAIKKYYDGFVHRVWKEGNKLYHTRLRYPKVKWFHFKKSREMGDQDVAAYASEWESISICFEYAVHFKEEMSAVMIHEVAHSFSTYYCNLIGRNEPDHGYLWRQTAKALAKILKCDRPVATHAYHELCLDDDMIKVCQVKACTRKRKKNVHSI